MSTYIWFIVVAILFSIKPSYKIFKECRIKLRQRAHRNEHVIYDENYVMQDYIERGLVVTEGDREALNLFWSPRCVPPGLPDELVQACIYIYWRLHKIRYTRAPFNTSIFNVTTAILSHEWKLRPDKDPGSPDSVDVSSLR